MEKTKWERWEKLVSVILTLVYSSERVSESRSVVSDSLPPHTLHSPWNSPGQNTGMGSHALLQRIFPTQGSNPGIPHCRWILYQLSQTGSPLSTQIIISSILTLETLHKKPHWRRCPSFWSYAHCRRHPPPQSHPGFEGNFGCSWDVVKSCDPGPGPPEEHGITEWRAGSPQPHRSFMEDWGKREMGVCHLPRIPVRLTPDCDPRSF